MSKITELIFNGEYHKLSSHFGNRGVISTSAGSTAYFHSGADYSTDGKKIAQYAIEDGYVFAAAKARDGANYVWIIYPRIKKAFLHYHFDSYCVKSGQVVKKGTLLGYTGKTGKATGIHLHLGMRDLSKLSYSQMKNMTWASLRSCPYIDPEAYAQKYNTNPYSEPDNVINRVKCEYKRGRTASTGVKWLQYELSRIGLYNGKIDGWFGPITENAVKEFQRKHKDLNNRQLECDGSVGSLTRGAIKNA